ncbi:MAG: rRNA maturation RNase YbeY [Erysipelotrichaceae bacterium]|nr:rRNA maturation RNase YbeY [Erysipelotrichaceae bacterium]MBP5280588.1 rRNA maturation RNase YbeY [Erysipelotrichaceae bacterium]
MVNIINRTKYSDFKDYYPLIDYYYEKTLKTLEIEDNYVTSLIICGPISIRRINREYRNIDRVTDVISFALLDDEETVEYEDAIELGDIFINRDRVISQAYDYGHSIKREFVFLFVHGLLHLLGYDHMDKEDEKQMFALQKKIIGDLK